MEEIKLPPPERAAKTAIGAGSSGKGTVGSYLKADALFSEKGGKKLDYGSGRGEGAKLIKADTYEPYVKSNPNYDDAKKIPNASYNKVTSLNVLNVLPPEARNEAVKNIGRILTVNGEAIVSTRGVKDVESAKNKVKAKDGYIIGKGDDARFQKGFTTQELKDYVQKTLGKGFTVENVKGVGKAAVKIKKLNIPRGFGGVSRQEGTPVINIQEQLLFKPKQKFSQGGDSKMDEDIKEATEAKSEAAVGVADTQLTNLSRQELMDELYRRGRTPEDIMNQTNLTGPEIEALSTLSEGKNRGGVAKQMELFAEGGLKEEGGTVDPVSGNDVPPGSTQEEVRDDIPAQLSEGEFVFPADVVRYIGLEKLMQLRQDAKQGLKQMEAMGQMGNSEEATMPDDLPFDETDLDLEEDLEYNTGGVVEAQQGTFIQNPTQMREAQFQNEGIDPTTQGMRQIQPNMATGVYQPDMGRVYGGFGGQQQTPVSFQDLLGTSAGGAPQTELVKYFNEKTGQTRMIPHLVNADGTRGEPIYPVPDGFTVQEPTKEDDKDKKKEPVKVPSAKVEDTTGDDDSGVSDLGGARTTIGGEEYAISYGLDGTVSITSVAEYNKTGKTNFTQVTPAVAEAIKSQTLGQLAQLGKGFGLKGTAFAELAKKMGVDTPRYDKLGNLITKGRQASRVLNSFKNRDEKSLFGREVGMFSEKQGLDSISRQDMQRIQEDMEKGGTERFSERQASALAAKAEKDRLAQEAKEKAEREAYLAKLAEQKAKSLATKKQQEKIAKEKAERDRREKERREREAAANTGNYNQDDDNYGGESSIGGEGGLDASSGVGGGGGWTATGGFINRKKMIMHKGAPKKNKRMKRGGLASR